MTVEILVPDLGESVIEVTVARWLKQEGDPVSPGEALVELETDKVNLDVSAQAAGVLEKILRPAGETAKVGEALALLAEPAAAQAASMKAGPEKAAAEKAGGPKDAAAQAQPSQAVDTGPGRLPAAPQVTPVAQRMAIDLGVDLARVSPSGPGGKITREDVQAFIDRRDAAQRAPSPAPETAAQASAPVPERAPAALPAKPPAPQPPAEAPGRETRVRMSRRRQTIARRLVEAQHTAAMLTTFNEVDMSAVIALRKRRRESFKERYGVDLGFMSFFVKATIGALKAFPNLNAEIVPGPQGDEIVLKHYYDIGVAIGAEEGLVVPVIRDADRLNFAGIESAIRDFVAKVKENRLTIEDLRGGTFSITNGGVYGSLMSTPILNPPQVGILGMHAIKERPVVVEGEIVVRPMMYLALSYDHRIVDGREAVQFLVRLKELLEDPETLLFG